MFVRLTCVNHYHSGKVNLLCYILERGHLGAHLPPSWLNADQTISQPNSFLASTVKARM